MLFFRTDVCLIIEDKGHILTLEENQNLLNSGKVQELLKEFNAGTAGVSTNEKIGQFFLKTTVQISSCYLHIYLINNILFPLFHVLCIPKSIIFWDISKKLLGIKNLQNI